MISLQLKCKAFGLVTLAALAAPGCPRAIGQEPHPRILAATISVAALRVPLKAREHYEKARMAAVAGREADYEREIAAALAIDPKFSEAYVLRASRLVLAERYAAAIEDALTAQRLEPGIRWATIVHAEACNGMHRFDEAFTMLDALPSVELGTWQAKYEMTRAVLGRGDAVAALQWSKLALQSVPESAVPNAILLRANALQMAHRSQEAIEQFDHYLALSGPLPSRTQVLAVRDRIQHLAQSAKLSTVASQ